MQAQLLNAIRKSDFLIVLQRKRHDSACSSYSIRGMRSIRNPRFFLSHVVVTAKLMNHLIVLKFLLLHGADAAAAALLEALQVNMHTCIMYII